MKLRRILPYAFLGFTAVLLVSLWIGWAWFVTTKFPETAKVQDTVTQAAALRGQYGDMFGGINALFTALLLAGAVYTIWIQQRQIESIRTQQIASERESSRAASLMAITALVNAKGTLLSTRYTLMTDMGKALSSTSVDPSWRPALEIMAAGNAEKSGNDFRDLENLASQLEKFIEEFRSGA